MINQTPIIIENLQVWPHDFTVNYYDALEIIANWEKVGEYRQMMIFVFSV
jgi:hypothetical protein